MKNSRKFLACLLASCMLAGLTVACSSGGNTPGTAADTTADAASGTEPTVDTTRPEPKDTHLIRNKDGSYGGTLSEADYGPGAPLNGEYDVEDSAYYTVNNDYYNMPSTEERLIIPRFASYQQTMQDSSGLACILMILNYAGKDVQEEYSELALVERYEKVSGTKVYGNGTTPQGLAELVKDLDLGWTVSLQDPAYADGFTKESAKTFLLDNLKAGKFVLVRYQSPVGNGWKVVIGYDTLGNVTNTLTEEELDHVGDDVVIFAEPFDGADHYQDGYATERLQDFHMWWRRQELTGVISNVYDFVIVDTRQPITYDLQPVDETPKQTAVEKHLPLNPDGTYGGTRDATAYGKITSGRGWWDHVDSNYYKINDFYNMGSEGTRILLPNYTVLQQTMGSSCGLCAITSVLKYYGVPKDYYDLEKIALDEYEQATGKIVKGKGCDVQSLKITANRFGFKADAGYTKQGSKPSFATYADYMQFLRSNLEEGRPVVVSHNMGSGHYLTVIGLDDMGTDYIYDDVVIIADSSDYWDGYQDGYNVHSAYKFFRQHANGNFTLLQPYVVIYNIK